MYAHLFFPIDLDQIDYMYNMHDTQDEYLFDVIEQHVHDRKTRYAAMQSQMMRSLGMNLENQINSKVTYELGESMNDAFIEMQLQASQHACLNFNYCLHQ